MLSTHCTLWCWAHCFSPCRGERIQNVQYAKICPALPSLPSTDSWAAPGDHAGTCSRKLYSRIPGLQSCPSRAQSHSRPIYYCRSNAKELFHLFAILGEQEVTKRPAENAKGLFSAAHHFHIPEQSTLSCLLRVETARAKQQHCWATLVMLRFSRDLPARPLTKARAGILPAAHLPLPPVEMPAIAADLQANWQGSLPRQRET